jgi:hypothetical protein
MVVRDSGMLPPGKRLAGGLASPPASFVHDQMYSHPRTMVNHVEPKHSGLLVALS